ncbi:MAG: 50S ribosomal protein L11 methyltransferase [Candidatus Tectomicrobia bacterium]|uniref:Ribosomal protein L11 methyltransferase n=1 Tax=Tectimicrobiota bacterium TaxID=2528274 RepID=A0A932CPQ4_UNCTE|nr:50S ribosomal protein L11 methyltransferase [Candidatus Tectomicrobia bacterium]
MEIRNGYIEVSLLTTSAAEEAVADFLFGEKGVLGLVIEDSPEGAPGVLLRASFAGTSPIEAILQRLRDYQRELVALGLAEAEGQVAVRQVPVEDWGRKWKEHFKPLPIGRHLVIAPSWEEGPFPEDRHLIQIDPAMSFGTGHHATTRMCLEALEAFMDPWSGSRKPAVLDIGTGTGILAIGAAVLGAQEVIALDIDPEACEAARKNLALNQGADRVQVLLGGIEILETGRRFDLILANLDAKGLGELFQGLSLLLAPGGQAICSGILVRQEAEIMAGAQSSGLWVMARRAEGEWLCLSLTAEEVLPVSQGP